MKKEISLRKSLFVWAKFDKCQGLFVCEGYLK